MTFDPRTLAQVSRCFCFLPKAEARAAEIYLLCQWANAPTGPSCDDPDAQAYITAAGLTDATQIAAICQFVKALKAQPAVGTKYWDREMLIYPLLGGTAASHAVNLRNPGTHNLTFPVAPIHSAFGIQGNLAGYADTGYNPGGDPGDITSQNNTRGFWYLDIDDLNSARNFFGCWNVGATRRFVCRSGANPDEPIAPWVNDNGFSVPFAGLAAGIKGPFLMQRRAAATRQSAYWNSGLTSQAIASTGLPGFSIILLGVNAAGVPSAFSVHRLSGFSYGTPLTSNAEWTEYKGIWDTFETAVGRGHPAGV